jgi:hypothetical protein
MVPCSRLNVYFAVIFLIAMAELALSGRADEGLPSAASPWTTDVPAGGHQNSFVAAGEPLAELDRQGRMLLLNYPATETTIGAPFSAINRFYERVNDKPLLRRAMNRRGYSDIGQSWSYIYARTGLTFYPRTEGEGAYFLPFSGGNRPAAPIGFSLFQHPQGAPAFTLSCAACHTRNLFGRPVLGGSTVQGGVTSSLLLLKKFASLNPREFHFASRPTDAETRTFHDMQFKASYIHGSLPLALGLENPASFVGLSLAGRAPDSQASRDPRFAAEASRSPLWSIPADTKPADLLRAVDIGKRSGLRFIYAGNLPGRVGRREFGCGYQPHVMGHQEPDVQRRERHTEFTQFQPERDDYGGLEPRVRLC